jgi:DNA-binding NtrC family response regulator
MILIADDQPEVRQALSILLRCEGLQTFEAGSPEEVSRVLRDEPVDLVLMDLNYRRDTTSGREGVELIAKIRETDPDVPLVAMTAWGSIEVAVAALKAGASDFVEKPWDNVRLLSVVSNQLKSARAQRSERKYRALVEMQHKDLVPEGIIAASPQMQDVLDTVGRVADAMAPVLITGENGVGKGLVATMLHRRSCRSRGALVEVNMGSIPEHLFESEMFGHVRGAFTDAFKDRSGRFELADGGTLFLDEIGNLPAAQQAKLLRVLESGQFERVGGTRTLSSDVRVVTATNVNLPERVAAGHFRQDLYYRLNTVEIHVPPLRERPDDILLLAQHFLERHGKRYDRKAELSDAARNRLIEHAWPGNVRELSHTIERALLLGKTELIEPHHLSIGPADASAGAMPMPAVMTLEEAERSLIRDALDRYNGKVDQAADALGVSRSAMYRRMQKHGISA